MADSANTGGKVDERDGMVVVWSDLTKADRLVVAELVAQDQQQQPREEPEAAETSGGQSIDDATVSS